MRTLSMWMLILFSSLFPAGISSVPDFTGYRGHSIQIRCPYDPGYETYIKYLCRGECSTLPWGTKDIPVESGSTAKDPRFSLEDNTTARVFTITITDLKPEDEGQYWCGIESTVYDVYKEIKLNVNTGNPADVSNSTYSLPSTSTYDPSAGGPHSDTSLSTFTLRSSVDPGSPHQATESSLESLFYINGGLVIIAIGLLVALTALYKHKKKAIRSKEPAELTPLNTTSANPKEDDCIYQEIDEQQQGSTMETTVNTIYSSVEKPIDAPVYSTIDEPTDLTIYSTATLPQQNPTK